MSTQADYTPEEWATLRRAPMVAGLALSLADPGGAIELTKETLATLRVASDPEGHGDLVALVSADIAALAAKHENPLGDFKPKGADAPQQVVAELGAVNAILTAKATPEEAAGFRAWIADAAQAAANAAKEGGFMGFHAVRVSEGEEKMLVQVAEALGLPPS